MGDNPAAEVAGRILADLDADKRPAKERAERYARALRALLETAEGMETDWLGRPDPVGQRCARDVRLMMATALGLSIRED